MRPTSRGMWMAFDKQERVGMKTMLHAFENDTVVILARKLDKKYNSTLEPPGNTLIHWKIPKFDSSFCSKMASHLLSKALKLLPGLGSIVPLCRHSWTVQYTHTYTHMRRDFRTAIFKVRLLDERSSSSKIEWVRAWRMRQNQQSQSQWMRLLNMRKLD